VPLGDYHSIIYEFTVKRNLKAFDFLLSDNQVVVHYGIGLSFEWPIIIFH